MDDLRLVCDNSLQIKNTIDFFFSPTQQSLERNKSTFLNWNSPIHMKRLTKSSDRNLTGSYLL